MRENKNFFGIISFLMVNGVVDGSLIKGGALYLFKRHILTFAWADENWTDESGKVLRFNIENKTIFSYRLAIGWRFRKAFAK